MIFKKHNLLEYGTECTLFRINFSIQVPKIQVLIRVEFFIISICLFFNFFDLENYFKL